MVIVSEARTGKVADEKGGGVSLTIHTGIFGSYLVSLLPAHSHTGSFPFLPYHLPSRCRVYLLTSPGAGLRGSPLLPVYVGIGPENFC